MSGAARVVGPHGHVERRRGALGEVINERDVGPVGGLRVGACRGLLVSVVEPDVGLGAGLEGRQRDPDERFARQRIVLFEVVLEGRFVVSGDEAQVAAVGLGVGEAEIADVQPDEDRDAADRLGDVGARRTRVDGDLLAQCPLVVPPGLGRTGTGKQRQREDERRAQDGERTCRARLEEACARAWGAVRDPMTAVFTHVH